MLNDQINTQDLPEQRDWSSAPNKSLERSKAQIAAGLTVPLEPALERLRASIARMEAKRAETDQK